MKKFFVISVVALAFASCSVHRATVKTTMVNHPTIWTATMASLDISKKRISYTYTPSYWDSKQLSEQRLMQNAIFQALQANGNADVLVQVNSMTTIRKGLFGRRIKTITVSGYPAYYVDFRDPSEMDLKSVYIFRNKCEKGRKKQVEGDENPFNKLFNNMFNR